ncbi:hypothetical protein ACMZ4X_02365 [Achromobacter marplatensis]
MPLARAPRKIAVRGRGLPRAGYVSLSIKTMPAPMTGPPQDGSLPFDMTGR